MASKNRARLLLAQYLLDHGLSPEKAEDHFGVSGMTLRRILDPDRQEPLSLETKFLVAKGLGEHPSALWPPIVIHRQQKQQPRREAA